MLKSLLKKQLLELNSGIFINRKSGKRRGIAGIIGHIMLILLLYVSICFMFGSYAFLLGELLYMGPEKSWLFYAMAAMMAILLGLVLSVFSTYSTVFKAKDNDFLLAMPIQPSKILIARMFGVLSTAILYTALAWLPMIIVSWILAKPTAAAVVLSILLLPVLSVFITVLSCALGWVVALISGRLKNKSFVTLAITLICFVAYYYVILNINELLGKLVADSVRISAAIKGKLFFVYEIAHAAEGDIAAFLIVCAITAVLFAICCYIMSRSFVSITTRNTGEKKVVYKQAELKAADASKALLRREFKHLTSNATFMLNSGLGIFFTPVIAVLAIIKKAVVRETVLVLAMAVPGLVAILPALVLSTAVMLVAMNNFTAPSVSLEGKTLWIVQSLPVSSKEVLLAKEKLHIVLNTPAVIILIAALCYVLQVEMYLAVLICAAAFSYIALSADLGLMLDILNPNLTWTSEAVPIKRSMSVTVMIFGGWFIGLAVAVAAYFLIDYINIQSVITVILVVFVIAYRIVHNWIMTKGAERFAAL